MTDTARILEVFKSIQGEGVYLGRPQIFLRFAQCNIECTYCDTPKDGPYKEFSVGALIDEIHELNGKGVKSISLTGGEPLLWLDFLKQILPILVKKGYEIYLETNGILYKNLKEIIRFVDIVSMDIKLPSSTRTKSFWSSHKKFLKIASRKSVFVKVVITNKTNIADILRAAKIIEEIDPNIALVLQPASQTRDAKKPDNKFLMNTQRLLLNKLKDVRVIPQIHKILKVR